MYGKRSSMCRFTTLFPISTEREMPLYVYVCTYVVHKSDDANTLFIDVEAPVLYYNTIQKLFEFASFV